MALFPQHHAKLRLSLLSSGGFLMILALFNPIFLIGIGFIPAWLVSVNLPITRYD